MCIPYGVNIRVSTIMPWGKSRNVWLHRTLSVLLFIYVGVSLPVSTSRATAHRIDSRTEIGLRTDLGPT